MSTCWASVTHNGSQAHLERKKVNLGGDLSQESGRCGYYNLSKRLNSNSSEGLTNVFTNLFSSCQLKHKFFCYTQKLPSNILNPPAVTTSYGGPLVLCDQNIN